MTRTKRVPPPRQTIVASNNRPKITITSNGDDHVTLLIPGVTRFSLSLAHSILSVFLCEIEDAQFDDLSPPALTRGEHGLCVIITIELRVGLRLGHKVPGSKVTPAVRRAKIAPLTKTLVEITRRTCRPIGGVTVYDVVEATT